MHNTSIDALIFIYINISINRMAIRQCEPNLIEYEIEKQKSLH
jgi:hypothetical protein